MSRPSSVVAPRNLTLTEELEKLEQSITLTLQGESTAIVTADMADRWHRDRSQLQPSA